MNIINCEGQILENRDHVFGLRVPSSSHKACLGVVLRYICERKVRLQNYLAYLYFQDPSGSVVHIAIVYLKEEICICL